MGFLNFILLAIPYIAIFYSYEFGDMFGGSRTESGGVSGYKVMDLWGSGFGGVMSSIVQIIILILGIALLAWGVMGLLKAFGYFDAFPDKLGKLESSKLGQLGLFGLAGLNILLLVFLIILTATNTESGYGLTAGYRLSAGIFISIVFTAGAAVALKILEKKFPASESGETIAYVCSKCGRKAKASDKFCSACGAEIIKVVPQSPAPEDAQPSGAEAKAPETETRAADDEHSAVS